MFNGTEEEKAVVLVADAILSVLKNEDVEFNDEQNV